MTVLGVVIAVFFAVIFFNHFIILHFFSAVDLKKEKSFYEEFKQFCYFNQIDSIQIFKSYKCANNFFYSQNFWGEKILIVGENVLYDLNKDERVALYLLAIKKMEKNALMFKYFFNGLATFAAWSLMPFKKRKDGVLARLFDFYFIGLCMIKDFLFSEKKMILTKDEKNLLMSAYYKLRVTTLSSDLVVELLCRGQSFLKSVTVEELR